MFYAFFERPKGHYYLHAFSLVLETRIGDLSLYNLSKSSDRAQKARSLAVYAFCTGFKLKYTKN